LDDLLQDIGEGRVGSRWRGGGGHWELSFLRWL
jgi:hypothetical protein